MSSATARTNPAYATLAYRKAVVGHLITYLVKDYTSARGGEPAETITSEDVFREDDEVPESEIHRYIQELQQEEESTRLQMLKFDFVERQDASSTAVKKTPAKSQGRRRKKAAPKAAQGKRSKSGSGNA